MCLGMSFGLFLLVLGPYRTLDLVHHSDVVQEQLWALRSAPHLMDVQRQQHQTFWRRRSRSTTYETCHFLPFPSNTSDATSFNITLFFPWEFLSIPDVILQTTAISPVTVQ